MIFFILHLLVYPASNGYNSYMDRDATPIGGLANPLQPTRQLFRVSLLMDVIAVLLSFFISTFFAVGILLYILASRAYSYRGIRLKQYPVTGFLTVFIFQGALIFWLTFHGAHPQLSLSVPWVPLLISSCLIGALYPLTQIYQHAEDRMDGVQTISAVFGKRGTFVLSMALFVAAAGLLLFWFRSRNELNLFYIFLLVTLPVVSFFGYWMIKVYRDEGAADFTHSLRMNMMATFFTAGYFTTLIILKH